MRMNSYPTGCGTDEETLRRKLKPWLVSRTHNARFKFAINLSLKKYQKKYSSISWPEQMAIYRLKPISFSTFFIKLRDSTLVLKTSPFPPPELLNQKRHPQAVVKRCFSYGGQPTRDGGWFARHGGRLLSLTTRSEQANGEESREAFGRSERDRHRKQHSTAMDGL